jgi:septal ring factor EnvC (AmiA/AmiB activator)
MLASTAALAAAPAQPTEPDTRNAIPATQAGKLPKTEEQYRMLQQRIQRVAPTVQSARQQSEALAAQAAQLRQRLVDTASKIQSLEQNKAQIDAEVVNLAAREQVLSAKFARDRVKVSRLLAVLERLQSDLPPAVALEPADALRSARGAMLLGGALPRVYGAAAALSRQLKVLKQTRAALLQRRKQSAQTAIQLTVAHGQLDQLLATKEREASGAGATYQALQARFDAIASQASDLKSLLDRVAALRRQVPQEGMIVVSASSSRGASAPLRPRSLAQPVVGQIGPDTGAAASRGLNFITAGGAAVVAPADSRVLFAGPYHKAGQVLILESGGGYDLVLAGLERVYVRPGDQLLAGEPVGTMPHGRSSAALYFELRQNGQSVSPAPWLGMDLRKAKRK